MMLASGMGHVEIVRVLLAAGAGVDTATNDGETALMFASGSGHVEVVRALLAAGADAPHRPQRRHRLHRRRAHAHLDRRHPRAPRARALTRSARYRKAQRRVAADPEPPHSQP